MNSISIINNNLRKKAHLNKKPYNNTKENNLIEEAEVDQETEEVNNQRINITIEVEAKMVKMEAVTVAMKEKQICKVVFTKEK